MIKYHGTDNITPHNIKVRHENNFPDSHYFEDGSMLFFGDTMDNYGVRLHESSNWELFRKKPVKGGQKTSTMFRAETFELMAGEFEADFDPDYEGDGLKEFFDSLSYAARNKDSMFGKYRR